MKTTFSLLLIILSAAAIANATTKKVLFLGNSYTYVNNLPQLVSDIATSTGDTLIFDANAIGGYRLMDHVTDATSLSKIAIGNWDIVVLQEQSQMLSFPIGQVQTDVFPYAHQLDSIIHVSNSCAKTLFYMTWGRKNGDASNCAGWPPVCTYMGMDSLLRERYLTMANDNHALVAPAGPIWRYLRANNPAIELYQSDESHPSEAGSYAIACGFYAIIFHKNPLNIGYSFTLAANDALSIRTAAKHIAFDSLSYWNVDQFLPQADFQFINTTNLQMSFTNNSQFANAYNWQFGDGNTSTQANPVHSYASIGTYQVRLIASKCSKSDTVLKSVTVSSTGGIENETISNMLVYPNPSFEYLYLPGNWQQIHGISVVDIKGIRQPIVDYCIKDEELVIDVQHLSFGIYFLLIDINDEQQWFRFNKK